MEPKTVEIKDGFVYDFLGLHLDIPYWEFDRQVMILEPFFTAGHGNTIDIFIEDLLSDSVIGTTWNGEAFVQAHEKNFGYNFEQLKELTLQRLQGKELEGDIEVGAAFYKVKFYINAEGDTEYDIIEKHVA